MIIYALLLALGLRVEAPALYYVIWGIGFLMHIVVWGFDMYKQGKEEK